MANQRRHAHNARTSRQLTPLTSHHGMLTAQTPDIDAAPATRFPDYLRGHRAGPQHAVSQDFRILTIRLLGELQHNDDSAALEQAINLLSGVLAAISDGHPGWSPTLSNLGNALQFRFQRGGIASDLEEAIAAHRKAVAAAPADYPSRFKLLNNLATTLGIRFEHSGEASDLDEAVATMREAAAGAPSDDPTRVAMLAAIGKHLAIRFNRSGAASDLDEAIVALREAAAGAPSDDPTRAAILTNVGINLAIRFERSEAASDLDEAIVALREAAATSATDNPMLADTLAGLGNVLSLRFQRDGMLPDLDQAIVVLRQAVEATPADDLRRATKLSNLEALVRDRFEYTGSWLDLDEAVAIGRQAVAATPTDNPNRSRHLSNLSSLLLTRFELTRALSDLEEAIDLLREAVAAVLHEDPLRPMYMSNLANSLGYRFDLTAVSSDLDKSIAIGKQAVAATIADDPNRPMYLSNLGGHLLTRFERIGNRSDLNEAEAALLEAVKTTPTTHPNRAAYLTNLGNVSQNRFEITGKPLDLDEAISTYRQALAAMPADNPQRAIVLFTLGNALASRFDRLSNLLARDEAFEAWSECVGVRTASASLRLRAALAHTRLAARAGLAVEAEAGFAGAIGLLPLVAWRGLERADREEHLASWANVARDAAAWAITAGHIQQAVVMLEQGRLVLWSQLIQLRGDLNDLRAARPDLAERLGLLRAVLDESDLAHLQLAPNSLLNTAIPRMIVETTDLAHRRDGIRRRAADEWDAVVEQVRALPGYSAFLAPPRYDQVAPISETSPVVIINTSRFRCDALLVTPTGLDAIALPELSLDSAISQVNGYLGAVQRLTQPPVIDTAAAWERDQDEIERADAHHVIDQILAWMWETIMAPILDALNLTDICEPTDPDIPRIWWCPTGPLVLLPLHAAGHHDHSHPGESVMDRVVSSYTPTLGALRSVSTRPAGTPADFGMSQRLLLVAVPFTSYGAHLPGVQEEIEVIADLFNDTYTALVGPHATHAAVLDALAAHACVHFACHGGVDLDLPTASGLYLYDEPLTIQALSRYDFIVQGGELAVLSSCRTAYGDVSILDEVVTISTAMHLAGYRHVIATLWIIPDRTAPQVMRTLYRDLINPLDGILQLSHTAHALHAAVHRLRAENHPPVQWMPYIHIGP